MRKFFTFLCAALMSVGMWALTPKSGDTWDETTKTLTVNSNPEDYAYWGESDIENLVISDAVTSIGVSAFEECSALTSVTIGNSVTSIGTSAFSSCYLLTSVEIPNSVEEIGVQAFASCSELTSVTIGNGVTSIGDYAFVDCSGLETVTINAESLESYGTDAFEGTAEDLTIYVPAGSVDTYKAGWAAYEDKIVAIGGDEPQPATTVVTITEADFPTDGSQNSFTKDGVTITTSSSFEPSHNLWTPTFTSSVGNFTKIEISAGDVALTGEGWSGGNTWTGNASSVSTDGDSHVFVFYGSVTITCTIEEPEPEPEPEPDSETLETNTGDASYAGTHFSVTPDEGQEGDSNGFFVTNTDHATISALNGETILSVELTVGDGEEYISYFDASAGNVSHSGSLITISEVNATSVELLMTYMSALQISQVKIYYEEKSEPTAIDEVGSHEPKAKSQKLIKNGQLLIERDGKIFNVTGAQVK